MSIYHVIKDPVHGTMQFGTTENNWIKPFIDSPHFQRLRHIKQQGMGDLIFPGAVHTRFNHCLGCCYVASQIAHKIGLAEEERQLVMIACLLHDIGHGPFSHTFEHIFQDKLIRHEAWTPFFLADYRTSEFFDHYHQVNPRHPLTDEKFLAIENMIMHKSTGKHLLADIVSSQLDADRLDYLLRDSHFCGVTYGQFDLRWMLNSMIIVNYQQQKRLGVSHKGIGVVEHYLMARRLMVRNIYLYPKTLALEFMLIQLLTYLSTSLESVPLLSTIKHSRLGLFLSRANQFNQAVKNNTTTETIKHRFLEENYSVYKELSDYDIFICVKQLAELDSEHPAVQIAKRLQYRHMPKIVRFDHTDTSSIEALLNDFKQSERDTIQDWQLALIKSPHQSYNVDEDPILIQNEHGLVKPLSEISLMINAIGDKYEQTAFLCIDKTIYETTLIQQLIQKLSQKLNSDTGKTTFIEG